MGAARGTGTGGWGSLGLHKGAEDAEDRSTKGEVPI